MAPRLRNRIPATARTAAAAYPLLPSGLPTRPGSSAAHQRHPAYPDRPGQEAEAGRRAEPAENRGAALVGRHRRGHPASAGPREATWEAPVVPLEPHDDGAG